MDTSEEYIKMCEKAIAIQVMWMSPSKLLKILPSYFYDKMFKGVEIAVHVPESLTRHVGCDKLQHAYMALGIDQIDHDLSDCGDSSLDWRKCMVWLPTQDQLQDMIDMQWFSKFHLFYAFANGEYPVHPYLAISHFKTMEQLWLAYVMKEVHGLYWDGNSWTEVDGDDHV